MKCNIKKAQVTIFQYPSFSSSFTAISFRRYCSDKKNGSRRRKTLQIFLFSSSILDRSMETPTSLMNCKKSWNELKNCWRKFLHEWKGLVERNECFLLLPINSLFFQLLTTRTLQWAISGRNSVTKINFPSFCHFLVLLL